LPTLTEEISKVMEPLRLAAIGTSIVGFAMMAIAIVALIISMRDGANRLLALGVVYLGMFVVATGMLLFLLWVIGEWRMPIVAAILPFLLLGFTAIRMRMASSRAFVEARKARGPRDTRRR
jgi:hypothetical protein